MQEILEKFPFLTWATYDGEEYIGIVGNSDNQLVSMYIFSIIPTPELKKLFLVLGEEWWWETNRLTPINISLKDRWKVFKPYMKTFAMKEFNIHCGPCTSIDKISTKRMKRKNIKLKIKN